MPIILNGTTGITAPALVLTGGLTVGGTATFATAPVVTTPQSMVMVNTHTAYGTLPTKIRVFSNYTNGVNGCIIQGTDITYTHDTVNGDKFTVNTNGVYSITTNFSSAADSNQGISRNTTGLNTDISVLAVLSERLNCVRAGNASGVGQILNSTWTGYLVAGDVIRAHGDGTSANINAVSSFTIVKVA